MNTPNPHPRRPRRFRLRTKSAQAIHAEQEARLDDAAREARAADLIGVTHEARPLDPTGVDRAGVDGAEFGTEEEAQAFLERLDAEEAAEEAAERAAEDAELDAEWAVDEEEADAAGWAADAGANADLAAAYGGVYEGYAEARAEQAAAREVLPGMSPAVRQSAAEFEEDHGRGITLAELRFIEHHYAHAESDERADDSDAGASEYEEQLDDQRPVHSHQTTEQTTAGDGAAEHQPDASSQEQWQAELERNESADHPPGLDDPAPDTHTDADSHTDSDAVVDAAAQAATDRVMHARVQHLAEQELARMSALAALPPSGQDVVLADLRDRTVGVDARADIERMHAAVAQLPDPGTTGRTPAMDARAAATPSAHDTADQGYSGSSHATDHDDDGIGL